MVDLEVLTSPRIFENYDSIGDVNYSTSVFMILVLVKELRKKNISEQKAFELVFRSFFKKNPSNVNWENIFESLELTLEKKGLPGAVALITNKKIFCIKQLLDRKMWRGRRKCGQTVCWVSPQ